MTANAFHVRLTRPVHGVAIRNGHSGPAPGTTAHADSGPSMADGRVAAPAATAPDRADIERQQRQLQETHGVLDDLVQKLMQLQEDMLTSHRQDIAGLAVEIARKVLMVKVRDGDYEIEQIIQEALKNAPMQQEVVVRLHPDDLLTCQALQQENPEKPLARLTLVGDASLGRAECLLETPKGVVKSFIENHLDKIKEALERAG